MGCHIERRTNLPRIKLGLVAGEMNLVGLVNKNLSNHMIKKLHFISRYLGNEFLLMPDKLNFFSTDDEDCLKEIIKSLRDKGHNISVHVSIFLVNTLKKKAIGLEDLLYLSQPMNYHVLDSIEYQKIKKSGQDIDF